MEQTEELVKALESANNGMWFPMFIIMGCFALVITVLLAYWKQSQKNNDKRHEDNEEVIKKLSNTSITVGKILVEIRSNQKHQQKELDKLTA